MEKITKPLTQLAIACNLLCNLLWANSGESVLAQSVSAQSVLAQSVLAQGSNIVRDNTLGAESSVVIPLDASGLPFDAINGGAIRDSNLFHSFREFNVREGRSAYFFTPSAVIQNVFARVTGGNRSEILGTLGTLQFTNGNISRSNANLFLINPSGIIFGQNSRLDLGGSFVATTANAVEFANQGLFSASNPETPKLLTVNPSAFLLNQIPAPIVNRSIVANNINPAIRDGLRVDGKSLLLLGGDINLDGGTLKAFGGKIELVALAAPGSVGLSVNGNNLDLSLPNNISKADISLTDKADIFSTAFLGSGEIKVTGNNIKISGNSTINSFTFSNQNNKPISIQASQVSLSDLSSILTGTSASGNSSDIIINTNDLNIQNSIINTLSFGVQGNAGNIVVRANNSVNLDKVSVLGSLSLGIGNDKNQDSGGDVFIETKALNIQNLSGIITNSFLGRGKPGNLTLKVTDSINLSNSFISASSNSIADGGNINIETGDLNLNNGSQMTSSNVDIRSINFNTIRRNFNNLDPAFLQGVLAILQGSINMAESENTNNIRANSGNINIRASKSVTLSGISPDGQTVNTITTETQGAGKAGNLTLSTDKLIVRDGSAISTQTESAGDGGDLVIKSGTVDLANNAQIIAQSAGIGKAGNINLNADGILNASNSNILTSSTQSSGGVINVSAKDIRLFDNSNIRTNVSTGTGGGGNITLTANSIIALNDSDILSFARDGRGGDINFNTLAFLSSPLYRPSSATTNAVNLQTLEGNRRVDVNASGAVSGTISGIPDISFLQNSLIELAQNPIDTNALLAVSCVNRRRNQQSGTFFITGSGGLAERPGDAPLSYFTTGKMQPISSEFTESFEIQTTTSRQRWKIGDSVVEPQGIYRLENGQRILSRECSD